MEYISMVWGPYFIVVSLSFATALAVVATGARVAMSKQRLGQTLMLAGFAVLLAAFAYMAFGVPSPVGDRLQAIEDTYGVELDRGQYLDLRYPTREPEAGDAVFGSTEIKAEGFTVETVRLAWDGDRLLLVDEDGIELPRR